MKFGVNTFIWAERFGPEQIPLLERIRKAGFDSVEVPLFAPGDYRPGSDVVRALEDSGLERTVCSVLPEDMSAIGEDTEVRARTLDHLRACVETAAMLGARVMAGPLYAPVGYLPGRRRTESEWGNAIETYQRLGKTLDEYNVTIGIEPLNRYETYFLNTAADAIALTEAIGQPKVGILFDTYHANIEEKNLEEAVAAVAPKLVHVHTCENDRGIPGTGHVDWDGLVGSLWQAHYDSCLTIESFGFSLGGLSAAASVWRDLAPAADQIAWEGLRFLREKFGATETARAW